MCTYKPTLSRSRSGDLLCTCAILQKLTVGLGRYTGTQGSVSVCAAPWYSDMKSDFPSLLVILPIFVIAARFSNEGCEDVSQTLIRRFSYTRFEELCLILMTHL